MQHGFEKISTGDYKSGSIVLTRSNYAGMPRWVLDGRQDDTAARGWPTLASAWRELSSDVNSDALLS